MKTATHNALRTLPSVDALLKRLPDEVATWGHQTVVSAVRHCLSQQRDALQQDTAASLNEALLLEQVRARLLRTDRASLRPVLNLTGTVLHTNLGRAVLPQQALDAIVTVAGGASNLEYNLETGKRGDRESHVEALVCEFTGAEAATAVNNNAAAVLLVLNTLARDKEVPVSRGELVEIGGSFRIPEVMERSGCRLVEVGSTNRTHARDYQEAVTAHTALLLKVHTSNYAVSGFTHAVDEAELAALAHANDLPLVVDLGSGNLVDFTALGLPHEPTAASALANGADLITFSGDKLLGGPQAGIIAGRADLVAAIKRNPLKRALRLDKMTLAGLAEILKLYRTPDTLTQTLPTLRLLTRAQAEIRAQAQTVLASAQNAVGDGYTVDVRDCHSQIGSGSLPVDTLPSCALSFTGRDRGNVAGDLAARLRQTPVPVIGRLHQGALWLDLRCLAPGEESLLIEQLQAAR